MKNCIKKIVDNVFLYGRTSFQILSYFRTIIYVLKQHCDRLNLKKCKWFQDRFKFVGMHMVEGVTKHEHTKN